MNTDTIIDEMNNAELYNLLNKSIKNDDVEIVKKIDKSEKIDITSDHVIKTLTYGSKKTLKFLLKKINIYDIILHDIITVDMIELLLSLKNIEDPTGDLTMLFLLKNKIEIAKLLYKTINTDNVTTLKRLSKKFDSHNEHEISKILLNKSKDIKKTDKNSKNITISKMRKFLETNPTMLKQFDNMIELYMENQK